MSSLSFLGNATSYLRIPNTDDFDFGTGDFTIEWYQYQTDSNSFPRIFQVGNYVTPTKKKNETKQLNFYIIFKLKNI